MVMPDNKSAASQGLPPHIQLIQMGRAFIVSRTVYVAAKLGLADQLASGPKSAAELAGPMRAAGFSSVVAYVHGRKRTTRIPFTLVSSVEWTLEHVPDGVRRRLAVSRPLRWVLGAWLVARRKML